MAGYYAAAEKLFTALRMVYTPLNTTLYPYMCKAKNLKFYKKIFLFVFSFNFFVSLLVFLLSGVIVSVLYGSGFGMTVNLLKIFSVLSIVMIPAIFLGYPLLAAFDHPGIVNLSVIIASGVHLLALLALIPIMNVYLVALMTIITQLIVISIRIYGVRKYIPRFWRASACAE